MARPLKVHLDILGLIAYSGIGPPGLFTSVSVSGAFVNVPKGT